MYVVFHVALLLGVALLLPPVARQAATSVRRAVGGHRMVLAAGTSAILAAHPSATGFLAPSAGVAGITILVILVTEARWSR